MLLKLGGDLEATLDVYPDRRDRGGWPGAAAWAMLDFIGAKCAT